jgi:hypothetical protein
VHDEDDQFVRVQCHELANGGLAALVKTDQ